MGNKGLEMEKWRETCVERKKEIGEVEYRQKKKMKKWGELIRNGERVREKKNE